MHGIEQPITAGNAEPETPDFDNMIDESGRLIVSWQLHWLPLSHLFVDYHEDVLNGSSPYGGALLAYQRKQEQNGRVMASMGKNGYKPDLFGVLIGTQREDGKIALGDGGTRYRFLKGLRLPEDTLIPVLVNHWDGHREISNYIDLNRERASLSQVDWFVAKVKVGDATATTINQILVEESGQGVGHKKGGWQAVGMLQYAYKRGNLRQTVIVLRQLGWLDQASGRSQGIIGGVSRLLWKGAEIERIMETCGNQTPKMAIDSARQYLQAGQSRAVAVAVALHLAKLYNYKKRSKKLDISDLISKTEEEPNEAESDAETDS